MVLTTALAMMRYVSEIDDRDFVDRLHSYFTTNLLIGLSVLVSFKQFGGKPIECLVPDIFSGAWEEYAENYCWAQDTYFVAPSTMVEGIEKMERKQRRISYYQWVPFFLLIEAACFRLPSLLWRYMAGHSGIKIREIIKMSGDPNNIKPDIRKANIRSTTIHLQGALRFHRRIQKRQIRPHGLLRICNLPYTSSFVTSMYLLTKFCYLLNALAQLIIMNSFLETDKYSFYGFGALLDLLNGTTWEQSGVFPRVSLCDFEVRVMGNLQEYTIQCVLVINIFNEKIFVLLWFWYMCLLLLTCGSFLFWLSVVLFPWPNRRFITQHLEMCEMPFDAEASQKDVQRFLEEYLRLDGLLVIRMLTLHTGVIFGTELVQSLWLSHFGGDPATMKRSSSFQNLKSIKSAEHQNLANQLQLVRRPPRFDRRRSSLSINPKISVIGEANERLIPPPLPSPSAMRMLERMERSGTQSSADTSRTGSPPDLEGRTLGMKTLEKPRDHAEPHRRSAAERRRGGEERSQQQEPTTTGGASSREHRPPRGGGGGSTTQTQPQQNIGGSSHSHHQQHNRRS